MFVLGACKGTEPYTILRFCESPAKGLSVLLDILGLNTMN